MFTITHNFAPAQPMLRPKPAKEPLTERKERTDRTIQPETRLWKLTAEAVKPKIAGGELLVLLMFLAVVASAMTVSIQELSRLTGSNAIERVTARALESSRQD